MKAMEEYVKRYLDWGLCIIPVPYGHKEPIIQWGRYQTEKPTAEELEKWFSTGQNNVAIVCGAVSDNFYPLDFDSEESFSKFFPNQEKILKGTPVVKTRRGYHVWFKSQKPLGLSKRKIEELNLEVLGEGHFIMAPPSLHPQGSTYEFLNPEVGQIACLEDYVDDLSNRITELLGRPYRLDVYTKKSTENRAILDLGPAYHGPNPKCIERLFAVREGQRNEAGIRIASFLLITRKLSTQDAWKRFKKWNEKNEPLLEDRELRAILDSAMKGNYVYGCDDPLKQELCTEPQNCPLAKYQIPPEVEEEVARILECDQPLLEIKKHLDNLIAGEDYNKQLLFILLLSGKSQDASMKQMILISGDPGVGKTRLMMVSDLFLTKTVGRFTEHGLDYSDLEGYEVLRLQEIAQADEEKQGVATVKFLSPDDKGFIVEYTVRDPETGEFTTRQKRVPPITFLSSTTRIEVDPQFERRCWLIFPDDSLEQTLKIRDWIADMELQKNEVLLGLRKWTDFDYSKMVLSELTRRIVPASVLIPFPQTLMDVFRPELLRVRGDYQKIITLTKLYCMLNQKTLPAIPTTNSQGFLATPRAFIDLLQIAEEPLVYMTSDLKKRTAKLLVWFEDIGVTEPESVIGDEERDKLILASGKSDATIRRLLNSLQQSGFLSGTDKRPKTWKLLYSLEAIRQKMSAISCELKTHDNLMVNASKEAREWLKRTLCKMGLEGYIQKVDWDVILERYPLPPVLHNNDLEYNQPSSTEIDPNHCANEKCTIIQPTLEKASTTPATSLLNSVYEVNDSSTRSLSISETVEQLYHLLPKRFIESDFVEHAVKLGLTETNAGDLFNHLQGSKIFRDGEGLWQWL